MFAVDGGYGYIQKGKQVTMALTDNTGSVVIEQSDGATGWFAVVFDGTAVTMDADNTMLSIYSPCKLRVSPTGCDVYLMG